MDAPMKRLSLGRTRFRPLDVAVLAAAGLLVVQAPLSVTESAWVPNLEPLARLALGGLLAGYIVERTRVLAPIRLLLGAVLGFEVVTWVFAQVAEGASQAERVNSLGLRVAGWLDAVGGGGVSNDP